MPPERPSEFDAAAIARVRDLLPTSLGSAEVRGEFAAELRARSVFVSRAANGIFLAKVKEVIDQVANGEMDEASARWALMQTLQALGYTPEGGFPDDEPGTVPPAVQGTLQDLLSKRRLDMIIRTQVDLMRGAGQQRRASSPERLRGYPAWELVRQLDVEVPRDWPSRWELAGGVVRDGRMIAFKGDPIWGELGSSGNFDDALDVDYPPFAFNSGMGWREISRRELIALGVMSTDGRTLEDWESDPERPMTLTNGPLPMPAPAISLKDLPAQVQRDIEQATGGTIVDGTLTTPDNGAALAERRAARSEARAATRAARLERSIQERKAEYARRNGGAA